MHMAKDTVCRCTYYLPLVVPQEAFLLFYSHMLSASMKTVGGELQTNPKSTIINYK